MFGTLELTWSAAAHDVSPEEEATAEACARVVALAVDNATLYQAQLDHARRLTSLLHAGRAVTSSLVIHEVLAALVRTAATSLGSPEALIFEYDADADTLTMRSIYQEVPTYYEELDQPYSLEDYPSDRLALESGDVIIETISDPDLPVDVRESMEVHDEKTCLTVPLRYGAECLGLLVLIETRAERGFDEAELEFARGFGEQAAMALHNARLFENVKRLHLANLRAVSSALTAKDFYTVGHAARVAAYAVLLAAELGWSTREIQQLEEVAYLHDVGKITVADRVLLKQGALTDEEWALMRQHPVVSAEIIEALFDEAVVAGVRHHHERYDGGGYPAASSAKRSLSWRACSAWWTRTTPCRRAASTDRRSATTNAWRSSGAAARSSIPGWWSLLRVLAQVAAPRRELQAAADDAAARIDTGTTSSCVRPTTKVAEFARVLRVLDETRAPTPSATSDRGAGGRAPVRGGRSDPDDDDPHADGGDSRRPRVGDALRRPHGANVVTVDRWGTWISAAAPIRADDGSDRRAGRRPALARPGAAGGRAGQRRQRHVLGDHAHRRRQTDASGDRVDDRRAHRALQPPSLPRAAARDGRGRPVGGRAVAVLFCDIDRFKQLNDRHGHLVGDDVLRRVSRILASSDAAATWRRATAATSSRVLLHDAGMDAALEVAERRRPGRRSPRPLVSGRPGGHREYRRGRPRRGARRRGSAGAGGVRPRARPSRRLATAWSAPTRSSRRRRVPHDAALSTPPPPQEVWRPTELRVSRA